mmetsp:Transcript_1172/g.2127  ORF Transcript_1172/g.2127 Transcript_1172/m.2127 type:complete len:342 (+) Transcript_1172:612-1637(+)
MAKVHKLAQWAEEIEQGFFVGYERAEEAKPTATTAANVIQRHWRGFKVRKEMARCYAAAAAVQSTFRGMLGRARFGNHQRVVAQQERQAFFHAAAREVQRTWRGYRSRKYVHSFYAQKAYLEAVLEQNQEARAAARAHVAELETYLGHQELEEARRRFKASCDGKHHLASTFVSPGVFNSPYAEFLGGVPVFEGVPVEEHLRLAMQESGKLRTPPVQLQRDVQQYTRTGVSLNAQTPYYAKDHERRAQAVHHKVMTMGESAFVSTVTHKPNGSSGLGNHETCRVGTPYESASGTAAGRSSKLGQSTRTLDGTLRHATPFITSIRKKELFEDNLVKTRKVVS